jgi:hypothetical protein
VVDADAVLDGDRDDAGIAHRGDAVAHALGAAIRQAPKAPFCTRSDGQPQFRFTSA